MKTKFSGCETRPKTTFSGCETRLTTDILIGGYYKHYKNKMYQVLDLAKHSEDLSPMVIYKSLYENPISKVWARPESMFLEKIETGEPRFQMLSPIDWPVRFEYFHSHIYYTTETKQQAFELYTKIAEHFIKYGSSIEMKPLIDRCLGPHTLWMFEFNFKSDLFSEALSFLCEHRNGLSILIHPISGNEILDHTDYAMFLGRKEALNLSILKSN